MLVAFIALAGVLLTRRQTDRHFAQKHELDQVKGLRERYVACAEQLGHDKPAVRQAGVYALAALADDWSSTFPAAAGGDRDYASDTAVVLHRETQVCLDLLCAYVRASTGPEDREVRISIASVIRRHASEWQSYTYDLRNADLSDVDLQNANLRSAFLNGANLADSFLIQADLSRAEMSDSNLTRAYLPRADLSDANLHNANLSGSDLTRVDLTGANLTHSNLSGANLTGANLKDTTLDEAISDKHTRWPTGFSPP